jgi:hypothetical protein
MGLTPQDFHALLASFCPPEVVADFIDVVERLPVTSKQRQIDGWDARAIALSEVASATTNYQIARTIVESRRVSPRRDPLRQFRELKRSPTKLRLHNILERDKDENDLRPAESAIRFAMLQCAVFGDDIPPDWIERLGDSPNLLRKVAEKVCDYFAYKVDGRGRPANEPLEVYADRLAQIYKDLIDKAITYAKATDTSLSRRAGEPYGLGLDFMLAGLRLIDPRSTPFQAAAQIDRLRTARRRSG